MWAFLHYLWPDYYSLAEWFPLQRDWLVVTCGNVAHICGISVEVYDL
jgi:hypothetical protein